MKTCTECLKTLSLDKFHYAPLGAFKRTAKCRVCTKAWHWKYNSTPERVRHRKHIKLKSLYGITIDMFEAMLQDQDFLCLICGLNITENNQVDHCHVTGKVRGILCPDCNRGLGSMRDDIRILRNAIKYLEVYNETK